jgi:hypothetical protein
MLMRMKFRETLDSADLETILPQMEAGFGKGNLRFDKPGNTLVIFILSEMVAIKDEYATEWCFVNYGEEDNVAKLLFSREVIEKLREYK